MINSLSRKLTALFICCALLLSFITFALWHIGHEQTNAKNRFNDLTQTHRSIEVLRSRVWTFLQYGDHQSLQKIKLAQNELVKQLQLNSLSMLSIESLERINNNLSALVLHEQNLINDSTTNDPELLNKARELLHARYNILMEEMSETLIFEQQQLVRRNAQQQTESLWQTSLMLILFTLSVSWIAYLILKRFNAGFATINQGIINLAKGDLTSRLALPSNDREFIALVDVFNQMKTSLQRNTVTTEELESEINKQTQLLKDQKDRLKSLSESDPLTGIYNRRAFNSMLEHTVARANRAGLSLAILFFDLDKFKAINDTKGHQAGDEILIQVSKRLQNNIRRSDFCGRFGGDEFIVCLNLDKGYEGVMEKASELATALTQPIRFQNELLIIEVSLGISLYPKDATTPEDLIKIADEQMYIAKTKSGTQCRSRSLCQNKNG
ncbi:GGDEF family protein [Pseudoalteromonas luteoviolacea B = ATCC 29581]|nr:GGDEF family protein [Pseudoalteromonas luteoviolacea B = ATCC 29581]